jgi:hypothetical protein
MKIGYWAQRADDEASEPSPMLGAASPEDAAAALAQRLIEQGEGDWIEGPIRVWSAKDGIEHAIIFDVTAQFFESEEEEGEFDCELEIIERE